jgi:DNA-binding response OmpR family regulator
LASVRKPARVGNCRSLVAEADEGYLAVIEACIRVAGCHAETVSDVEAALASLEKNGFDIVVWGVPPNEKRQLEAISRIRAQTEVPLILVDDGAEMAELDLDAGADQVLPKPFIPGVLISAIKAALRRAPTPMLQMASRIEVRGMVFDGEERELQYNSRRALFTRQEWELLAILLTHPNRFFSASEILRLGWKGGDHEAEQLRTYVHRLRQKLRPLALPCELSSQRGRGYRLSFQ